jgi:hypothetical protein
VYTLDYYYKGLLAYPFEATQNRFLTFADRQAQKGQLATIGQVLEEARTAINQVHEQSCHGAGGKG